MSIHHHLRISTKLLLGFGLLALVVLIVSAIAFRSLDRAEHRMEAYLSGIDQRQMLAADLRSAASRRAIAARNLVLATAPADRDGEREAALHAGSELRSTLATLQERLAADGVDPQEHRLVEEIEAIERRYADAAARILALAAEGRRDEAVGRINAECRPLLAALLSALQSYVDHERAQARAQAQAARTDDLADQRLLAAVCAAALLSAVVLGVLIGRSITAPIGRAVRAAEAVAAGQLGEPIVVDRRDEAGQLLAALQAMNENLVGMVGRVRESADGIASATSEIATGHRDLSGRTEQQASALQQAAASMHQMTESIERNADSVRRATTLAESVAGAASRGGAAVQRVVETMDDIAAASRKIEAITGVIDAIAFQTNILALNAAVEAARAGEHGRGFAVVASEVRALAQRSGAAAKEINTLIGDSVGKVGHGTRLVREAGQTIEGLVGEVRGMSALMAGIDTANGEQRDGIRQVNLAVTSIDAGTQQNAALVEESTAASESLRTQAEMLRELIGVFRIRAHAA